MFATVDSLANRTVYTLVNRRDGSTYDTSKPFGAFNRNDGSMAIQRAVSFPDDSALEKLAIGVLDEYTLYYDDPATPDDDAVSVIVEVHTIRYSSKDSVMTSKVLRSFTLDVR